MHRHRPARRPHHDLARLVDDRDSRGGRAGECLLATCCLGKGIGSLILNSPDVGRGTTPRGGISLGGTRAGLCTPARTATVGSRGPRLGSLPLLCWVCWRVCSCWGKAARSRTELSTRRLLGPLAATLGRPPTGLKATRDYPQERFESVDRPRSGAQPGGGCGGAVHSRDSRGGSQQVLVVRVSVRSTPSRTGTAARPAAAGGVRRRAPHAPGAPDAVALERVVDLRVPDDDPAPVRVELYSE